MRSSEHCFIEMGRCPTLPSSDECSEPSSLGPAQTSGHVCLAQCSECFTPRRSRMFWAQRTARVAGLRELWPTVSNSSSLSWGTSPGAVHTSHTILMMSLDSEALNWSSLSTSILDYFPCKFNLPDILPSPMKGIIKAKKKLKTGSYIISKALTLFLCGDFLGERSIML